MKIFFDTDFYENGNTIDLMSIGMVREDGQELYLINAECDWSKPLSDHWHRANTLPIIMPELLKNPRINENQVGPNDSSIAVNKEQMRRAIRSFTINHKSGEPLEFWADYCCYDWVVLCQLFGSRINLPEGWPMYCNNFQQLCARHEHKPQEKKVKQHNALQGALWLKESMDHLCFTTEVGNPAKDL